MKRLTIALVSSFAVALVSVAAGEPTGKDIAEKAKKMKLDAKRVGVGKMNGKDMTLTPVVLPEKEADFDGMVGVLENGAAGDETTLAVGKHNLFVSKLGDGAQCFAETDKVLTAAKKCKVTKATDKDKVSRSTTFTEKGWCFNVCLLGIPFTPYCAWWSTVCF